MATAASTRLRHAFRYPADSDSDDPVEGIDEEEQEKLISTLHSTDASKSRLYTTLLLVLPLLPILTYLPSLITLPSLLAIASLATTAYILYYIPLPPASTPNQSRTAAANGAGARARPAHLDITTDSEWLVKKYIVPVNAVLCAILAVQEWVNGRGWRVGMAGGGYVPAFVFLVILFARTQLRPVDISELERLRYRYKGA
ncbi:hypothetical protein K432DRAFT_423215 [Lepidopterella palustris CBS 459.81]|uniref:Uncharacterized protein n=1 Tax=Lepidopterella palustris CBS 459.81 TaxID=1314670 RepID=A0A8E2JIK6_9PEZI|nr:hypothetical protein K432DRAFT_423215 [Lepidopterella palustris CBS 459.81]